MRVSSLGTLPILTIYNLHCTMNFFGFQKWPFKYIMVKSARFSSFSTNCCNIWWFFMFILGSLYQILQNFFWGKFWKNLPMILITEMAALETKNVHSVLAHYCTIINTRFIYSSFLSWKQNKVLVVSLAIQVNTLVLLYFKPSLILTSQLLPRVYLHFTFAIYYLRLNSL